MKSILVTLIALFSFNHDIKIPKTWDKDLTIVLSHHGSMNGGFTDLKFTYDSCIYNTGSNQKGPTKKVYKMTEKDRVAILDRLRGLKLEDVHPEDLTVAVRDGWSQSICLGVDCIEGGTSVKLSENDYASFSDAYNYLEQFAINKTKKMEKR